MNTNLSTEGKNLSLRLENLSLLVRTLPFSIFWSHGNPISSQTIAWWTWNFRAEEYLFIRIWVAWWVITLDLQLPVLRCQPEWPCLWALHIPWVGRPCCSPVYSCVSHHSLLFVFIVLSPSLVQRAFMVCYNFNYTDNFHSI